MPLKLVKGFDGIMTPSLTNAFVLVFLGSGSQPGVEPALRPAAPPAVEPVSARGPPIGRDLFPLAAAPPRRVRPTAFERAPRAAQRRRLAVQLPAGLRLVADLLRADHP